MKTAFKLKCCASRKKCKKCPLLALKKGLLPEEYTVKKRIVVSKKTGKPIVKKDCK